LGIPFEGTPGKWNAITDVAGVEVGHRTLIEGSGPLVKGKGPVRTGVGSSARGIVSIVTTPTTATMIDMTSVNW